MEPSRGPDLRDRIRGCLLGAACGDGLGLPFEGEARVDPTRLRRWCTSGEPLTYSDDTAMMRILAHHLGEHQGAIDEDELLDDFAREWRAEPQRGYGLGPPAIFRCALDGGDWRAVARGLFGGLGSLGNGGAMRVAPAALVPGAVGRRVALARQQAGLTHRHGEALDGAAMLCGAIAQALEGGGDPDPATFLAHLAPHVMSGEFRGRLQLVQAAVHRRLAPAGLADCLGNDVSARGSVPIAVALFLLHPNDPEAAITSAIAVGGDTDTIAAMTGALAGARCGAGQLPSPWLARLEDGSALERLGDRLLGLHSAG